MKERIYAAIDLKSFYASVECVERALDPLTTHLVVADASRTEKTICLAVSPSLKALGISGRARLFEVVQRLKEKNAQRLRLAPYRRYEGQSYHAYELASNPSLAIDYIAAPPRMALYLDYSSRIYHVYMKYVAPEDMHVYSIDEVFMDITDYLETAGLSAHDYVKKIIRDVLKTVGITATAGIGTNPYLAKIAMDITAKHIPADQDGVRIAELDEMSYRQIMWSHQPLTDFWRVGKGYAKKLEAHNLYTMGDIARCSLGSKADYYNEDLLYNLFGVNAELLIDHAWGYEPCTIKDIRAYKPKSKSKGVGQVLLRPYTSDEARIIVQEMIELLVLDLVEKELVTDQIVLTIGYDTTSLSIPEIRNAYKGPVKTDYYGRQVPKHAHGTANIKKMTSSTAMITEGVMALYDQIINPILLVRRVSMAAGHVEGEHEVKETYEQLNLFTDYAEKSKQDAIEAEALKKEKRIQHTVLDIKKKFGKNAILKGTNLQDSATTKERNKQIGGHKA